MGIKISDLSVGDWVYHDDIVFGREIAKIDRLIKDKNGETIGITVYRSDGAFGVVGYIWTSPTQGDLHPIPITPEILEANGLFRHEVDADNPKRVVMSNSCMLARTYEDVDWWRVLIYDEEELSAELFNGIVYSVHQLQHALRLAGVEKEIIMPKK